MGLDGLVTVVLGFAAIAGGLIDYVRVRIDRTAQRERADGLASENAKLVARIAELEDKLRGEGDSFYAPIRYPKLL